MNEDKMELEEAIKIIKNVIYDEKGKPVYYIDISFSHGKGDIGAEELIKAIEIVLRKLESYKRLAEANLKDSEEFKNNMCEHRCILKSELQELQENSIPKKKIEDKKNKIHDEYINILSEYGNVDTDITFDIPNKNVRKHLDELILKIMLLQELLEDK